MQQRMERFRIGVALAVSVLMLSLVLGYCGSVDLLGRSRSDFHATQAAREKAKAENANANGKGRAKRSAGSAQPAVLHPHVSEKDFNRDHFDNSLNSGSSTRLTNPWFPRQSGMEFAYEGTVKIAGRPVKRESIVTVTDLTKVVDGVRTRVVLTRDFTDDQLVSRGLAFLAQDKNGAVWHLGQYSETYAAGRLTTAPTWISGLAGAAAGIVMQATPKAGAPGYSKGRAPVVSYTDRAEVRPPAPRVCVRVRCYRDVLVVGEAPANAPDAFRVAYYARGVGTVKVISTARDPVQEALELASVTQLAPADLAAARTAALGMETEAYLESPDVYGRTPRAEGVPAPVEFSEPPPPPGMPVGPGPVPPELVGPDPGAGPAPVSGPGPVTGPDPVSAPDAVGAPAPATGPATGPAPAPATGPATGPAPAPVPAPVPVPLPAPATDPAPPADSTPVPPTVPAPEATPQPAGTPIPD